MEPTLPHQIKARIARVKAEMAAAAHSVNRAPEEIRLVVVTKGQPLNTLQAVVAGGARIIGESYAEEAVRKIEAWEGTIPEWHMIGHIQSRKARLVAEHFSWVHSLDRIKLAQRLDRFAGESGKKLQVFLECNLSGEESKFGFLVREERQWPVFAEEIAVLMTLPNLQVRGLMTMPPWNPDPEVSRPYFRHLRRLQTYLAKHLPQSDWKELSMGMSNDFGVAIQEGATFVRVGTAIVGSRK